MSDEYKENVKYETFEQFWDDNYGKEYGHTKEIKRKNRT